MTDAPKIDTQAPERIFAWSFNNWQEWGGYVRGHTRGDTNLGPFDEKERATGAEYVRADLSVAREAAAAIEMREAAAQWHDLRIDQLNQQIRENDEYLARSGKTHSEANDYCRESVLIHRVASDSIRALPLPDTAAALDRLIAEREGAIWRECLGALPEMGDEKVYPGWVLKTFMDNMRAIRTRGSKEDQS